MKIRSGFVSNSSSSSFLIFGAYLDNNDELLKLMINHKTVGDETFDEDELDSWGIGETVTQDSSLEYHIPYDNNSLYIGVSWDNVKDEETGKQFKERVLNEFNKMLPDDKKMNISDLSTYSEAWYDG